MSELEQSLRNGPVDGTLSSPPSTGRKRILLIEDEALTRLIVLNRLRRAGFEVDVASTGKLALEKLRIQPPDALFLDLLLPDIPGVEVIAEARKDAKFGDRPIYVCTSAVLMGVWTRRAAKAGATKVFNKLSTRIEDIVAEVATDLLGEAPVAATLNSMVAAPAALPAPTGAPAEVKDHVAELCTDLQSLAACNDQETRATKCGELRDKAHSVASGAAVVQMHHLATTATALESLLKELGEKPKLVTETSLRTISSAVEVLDQLSHGAVDASEEKPPEFTAVVVDDGLVSRTSISNALRRTNFKTTTFSDTKKALAHLRAQPADLVVLGGRLSQPDGTDLCSSLRELTAHEKTPVICVGSTRDLKRSSHTPSNSPPELVSKPFISMELSLKALSLVLKNRAPNHPEAAAVPAPVASVPPVVASDPVAQARSASAATMATQAVSVTPGFRPDQPILQAPVSPSENSNLPPASGGDAVMELNEAAKIVSADEACALMFGWQSVELIGQDAGILFHGGLENELGRFLQQPGAPQRGATKPSFQVIARRKDGTEFPAAVSLEPRLEGAQFCWTAAFRPLPASEIAAMQTVIVAPPEMRLAHGQSPALAEALARLHQSQATLQSANEELHRQFQAISAEAAMHRDELAKNEKERQELAQRIYSNEIERTRAQAALAQESQARQQLEQNLQNLKTTKADLESQLEARSQSNEELAQTCRQIREQLEEAKAANDRAETIRQQELARTSQLEENLANLRRTQEELNGRLTAEQQAAAESTRHVQELESRARESAAEFERIKAELEKQSAERGQSESQWRDQLATSKAATEKAEAAWLEESERTKRFEEELTGLKNLRDELNSKLAAGQQAVSTSKQRGNELENRLSETAGELERVKAESHRHSDERGSVENDLRTQLSSAKVATEQAEEALKEKTAQSTRLEQELAGLRQERQDLQERYVAEQQEDLKSKRRIKELERHLREGANNFAGVKVELEKRAAEREHLDAELREQLEAAKVSAQQAEAAHQEEIGRRTRIEEELTGLRQIHDELSGKFSADRETAAESSQRIEALENRLRENAAELARAKSALESHAAERAQLESHHQNIAGNAEDLGLEMCRLRENEAAHRAELSELERRIREGVASLARVTADLEKERGERRRVEQRSATLAAQLQELHGELRQHLESEKATQQRITDLEQQLHEREQSAARIQSELQKEAAERQLAEEQLKAVGDMSAQLRKYLSLFEESKKVFKRTQEDLESRLQTSLKAVGETDSRLQKEASERQRLEEALASAQRSLHEQTERGAHELSRLQSELQVEQFERKRLEGDAVQSRYASLDSARVGRGLVNSLRREIRQPVDSLLQTTRRLLEIELPEEQKKLVESVLENALLVQTSLQETGTLTGGSARAGDEGQPEPQSPRPPGLVAEKPVGDLQP